MRRLSALLLAVGLLVAGCSASSDQSLGSETSAALQASVLAVSEAAAADDLEEALDQLDELEDLLLDEFEQGAVTDARFSSISAAIILVRADLERLISEQATPDKPGNSDKPGKPEKPEKQG